MHGRVRTSGSSASLPSLAAALLDATAREDFPDEGTHAHAAVSPRTPVHAACVATRPFASESVVQPGENRPPQNLMVLRPRLADEPKHSRQRKKITSAWLIK